MPRVLIITYYWPPSGGAGVQRWLKFTKYLPGFGWEPVIYTPSNPEAPATDDSLEKDIPEGITILKTPIFEPYGAYKRFVGMKKGEAINAGFLSEKKKPGFAEKVSVWIRGNFFIPDARKFWIRPSIKYLNKYLSEHPVDAIVSTGPPHSMHLIALGLKAKIRIKWIADFRDTWTGIDFYHELKLTKLADRRHRKLEKLVLDTADVIIGATQGMSDELRGLGAKRSYAILNGFDDDDFTGTFEPDPSKFTIVHLGAINKDRAHPAFFRAVSELCDMLPGYKDTLVLKFIGKVDIKLREYVSEYKLEGSVIYIPYIPHNEIAKELQISSVLYLPVNNTPIAWKLTTGKIFEYLAAGRPIVGTGPLNGEAARVLKETRAGEMLDFDDVEGIKTTLTGYFEQFKAGTLTLNNKQQIAGFSRKNLTEKLTQLLNE